MLRAAHAAQDRSVELLVVSMPDGRDPAELVAEQGADAFRALLDRAHTVAEFEVRRVLASSDLSTPRGRDKALSQARPIISTVPANTATRDELVRYVADRLDVDRSYLMTQSTAPTAHVEPDAARTPRPALVLDASARFERSFLTMCLGSPLGREYLERLGPEHFSFPLLDRVREHLLGHWDDPLIALPDDDESFERLIKEVVLVVDNDDVSADDLRLAFIRLNLRRVERALRQAEQVRDFDSQRALASERQGLRDQIDELMGLTL
jgi:DNA primase